MENFVSFEIAKLLKEKGFRSKSEGLYDGSGELLYYTHSNNEMQRFRYEAPTVAVVVMWLYEKHRIWIAVNMDLVGRWYYDAYIIKDGLPNHNTYKKIDRFNSPTEAYEAAIEYILNNLI